VAFPSSDLGLHVDLKLNGTWTDLVALGDVRSTDPVNIRRGLTSEGSAPEPSSCSFRLENTGGKYSPRNPTGANYGLIGRNTPVRVSVDQATSYLSIDQATGPNLGTAYVSTPDAAALDITGAIDLRWDGELSTWAHSGGMELIGKWTETGNQRAYRLTLEAGGRLLMWWSTAGTSATGFGVYSDKLPISSGRLAVRAAFSGAGLTFYTSDSINGTWTQHGPVLGYSPPAIFASTAPLRVLDNPDADRAQVIRGKVFAAQVRNSAATLVANPDFTAQAHGATSFADSAGRTWTLNGNVSISKRDYRFSGEISAWPVKWTINQRDVYVPIEAAGPMRRLGQGVSPLHSPLYRSTTRSDPIAYWPIEDGSGATLLGLGIDASTSPADPMYMVNTASLATNSDFPGSEPVAEFNGASLNGRIKNHPFTGKIQLRFLAKVATGSPSGAVIARMYTRGTAFRWDLIYRNGGTGELELSAYDIDGSLIGGSGIVAFNCNDKAQQFQIELTQSGGNVNYAVYTLEVGDTVGGGYSASLVGVTIGALSRITMNPNRNLTDTAVGHVSYRGVITDLYDQAVELNGYSGELASARFARLCGEEGLEYDVIGDVATTEQMGVQRAQPLLELLKECAFVDGGHLYESRQFLGLVLRTRESLFQQPAGITIPYGTLGDLEPVEDDANVVNDITVTRPNGSSSRAVLGSGALSVLAPPSGIGRYDSSVETNVADDTRLPNQAGWRLHVGTVDEARYPQILIRQENPRVVGSATLLAALVELEIGDRAEVTSPPAWLPPETISQLVIGWSEELGQRTRAISLVCAPAAPFNVPRYERSGITGDTMGARGGRYSSSGTTVVASKTTTATSWAVTTPSGPVWTTDAAQLPLDMMCEGERMTLTAVSGTTANQTMTFVRSVNGVVKTHGAGAILTLFQPAYYG
jgi:hypothetical protein